jgi:hypothetical protein
MRPRLTLSFLALSRMTIFFRKIWNKLVRCLALVTIERLANQLSAITWPNQQFRSCLLIVGSLSGVIAGAGGFLSGSATWCLVFTSSVTSKLYTYVTCACHIDRGLLSQLRSGRVPFSASLHSSLPMWIHSKLLLFSCSPVHLFLLAIDYSRQEPRFAFSTSSSVFLEV